MDLNTMGNIGSFDPRTLQPSSGEITQRFSIPVENLNNTAPATEAPAPPPVTEVPAPAEPVRVDTSVHPLPGGTIPISVETAPTAQPDIAPTPAPPVAEAPATFAPTNTIPFKAAEAPVLQQPERPAMPEFSPAAEQNPTLSTVAPIVEQQPQPSIAIESPSPQPMPEYAVVAPEQSLSPESTETKRKQDLMAKNEADEALMSRLTIEEEESQARLIATEQEVRNLHIRSKERREEMGAAKGRIAARQEEIRRYEESRNPDADSFIG